MNKIFKLFNKNPYKLSKLQKSPEDDRDHIFKTEDIELPKSISLIGSAGEIERQGQIGSCTANAACSLLEIAYKRAGKIKDFSRLYVYHYIMKLSGTKNGGYPRFIGKALKEYGVCLEKTWKYLPLKQYLTPSKKAREEAKEYPTIAYERILNDENVLKNIKTSLAKGIPVLTGMKVFLYFYALTGDWRKHDWGDSKDVDANGNRIDIYKGRHMVLIIGYDDKNRRFLAENSWGRYWGDFGFFGIPYDKVTVTKSVYEFWVLSKIGVDYVSTLPKPKPKPIFPVQPKIKPIKHPKLKGFNYVLDSTTKSGYDPEDVFLIIDENEDIDLPYIVNLKLSTRIIEGPDKKYESDPLKEAYIVSGLNASTSHVACSALELIYKRAGKTREFSRLYLYWFLRQIDIFKIRSNTRDVCNSLKKYGVCLEETLNYKQGFFQNPKSTTIKEGKEYAINEFKRIGKQNTVRYIKTCLSEGIPVMATMEVGASFTNLKGYWINHNWSEEDIGTTNYMGIHNVLIIGYDDRYERFLAENSWGAGWGNLGFFGIPYNKINKSVFEFWIFSDPNIEYYRSYLNIGPKYNKKEVKYKLLRTITPLGYKRTNLINMLNKLSPKGLGLNVQYKPDTLKIIEEPIFGKLKMGITKNGHPRIDYIKGSAPDKATVSFEDKKRVIHLFKIYFIDTPVRCDITYLSLNKK